ncbi:universal stress protein [Rhodococcus sp. MEB041]|uniref:universal stress protein n=1 Tax=Rhodococcus sp. MEB041 TaxID=3040323 RepID=UPI00254F4A8D|nr:universal stress protein [Rhodococcus sp. MEB041]
MTDNAPIVVGVDGSGGSFDAVRWAARAAELRGTSLHLVSTYQDRNVYTTLAAIPAEQLGKLQQAARSTLDAASEIARGAVRNPETLSTSCEGALGSTVSVLLDHAVTARMLVVGSRGNNEYFAELLGSVSAGVTARAHCPVVVVQGQVTAERAAGPVVVGVDGSRQNRGAVGVAFDEASVRGARLVAVHAGDGAVLAESLAGWQEQFPDVAVERALVRDDVVDEIVRVSITAQAVVVGTRCHGFSGVLPRSTSRTLAHRIDCPLIVVGHVAD